MFTGYWIEEVNPGTFQAIFYEKQTKINQYKNIRKEVDEFIKDINSEYESIQKLIIILKLKIFLEQVIFLLLLNYFFDCEIKILEIQK